MKLQAVDLQVTDVGGAAEFLGGVWGLLPVGSAGTTRYFRGTGDSPYVISVSAASAPAIGAIVLAATPAEMDAIAARARATGVPAESIAATDAPGGGRSLVVRGPEAQTYRFVASQPAPPLAVDRDRPIALTHAVLNTTDRAASERFALDVLGLRVSDRTGHMTFVRCDRKHHCVAYAGAQAPSLNHLAFEMADLEAVMRGIGRLRDAGFPAVWGPGRDGPGHNVFGYFVAPFGGIVEYTAEVQEVGDDYKVGGPEDWKWPPGRVDHWGISTRDTAKMGPAERVFAFRP
jgi:2,3-dihydroxy-p-cumate/2,3-dihydroxybenzoate 3,4-dioxygenase